MFTLTTADPDSRAARLIGRDYLSYSSISTYQTCPLRFYFRYVLELPETPVSSSLAFGGAVHAAIEFHHRQFANGRRGTQYRGAARCVLGGLVRAYGRRSSVRQR